MNQKKSNGVRSVELVDIFTVSIPIPKKTSSNHNKLGVPYEHFGIHMANGWLNNHLYKKEKYTIYNSRYHVEIRVCKKIKCDDRFYFYIDIHPTAKPVEYDRKIYMNENDMPPSLPLSTKILKCYGGALTFTPRNA